LNLKSDAAVNIQADMEISMSHSVLSFLTYNVEKMLSGTTVCVRVMVNILQSIYININHKQ